MDWTALRRRFRAAPLRPPPAPWRPLAPIAIGGLTDVGFGFAGRDLLFVSSSSGRGVFDCVSGERVARDYEEIHPDDPLVREGIGPLAGMEIRMAGLWGGGLLTGADEWSVEVVAPDWPVKDVILTKFEGSGTASPWWRIHREEGCELRAFGFSPTGTTLAIASSCDLRLFTRAG